MEMMLQTQNLCKYFRKQKAVNNVSLNIEKGQIYGLLGPNGAGKSTTLKMLTGMMKPTAGKIYFDGKLWDRKDLSKIGALIENPPIYENLSARENLKVRQLLLGTDENRIDEVLQIVSLTNTGKKKAGKRIYDVICTRRTTDMSMNVSTTTAAYANYQNNYKTGTANKKKETAQTTENTKLKENTTESIAEKNLSKAAQKMLENLRGSRNDMDFMVADFENGDNAKDILAQSDKEYTVIFSKEEMEKMASDPKYYAEKMHSIEGVLRMTDEINAQFGFERAFGKTNDNADADTKITKFGISFNSDGTTTFFAQLEKSSASQKEYLEKLQEKKAAEKKEAKKKEQSKQTEVRKTTVQANSKEELLDKIKNIDWDSIKPEENKIGGRFDFSI